jgi:hypothetical protein
MTGAPDGSGAIDARCPGAVRAFAALCVLVLGGACADHASRPVIDPIPEVPASQQRLITRGEFDAQWPFTVGQGVIGCVSKAVVFRANGLTYALNDLASTATSPRYAAVAAIQRTQSSPPSHPLSRITQERREQVFADVVRCQSGQASALDDCRRHVRLPDALSEAELEQIEAEGRERRWRPLTPTLASLDPVVAVGLTLCGSGG